MIFELVKDFADVLEAMPNEYPQYHTLKLLDEAVRRDMHFIDRHPTTLFQCMWNTCWWCDCPERAAHMEQPTGEVEDRTASQREPRLSGYMELWRTKKSESVPNFR
jgi:hypothetical protein